MPQWAADSPHLPELPPARSREDLELHLAAIEYALANPITIRSKEDIQSSRHWSELFEPFDHQVQNLITFCRRAPVALIADDVGLGKTISAGLVLSELQVRKKVRRALVLCPKLLIPQWCEELATKFRIRAVGETGNTLPHALRTRDPVVVTTYDSARLYFDRIREAGFDLLILDEAHRLRNLHGTNAAPQIAKTLHQALGDRIFKYVLMLTATPIQNRLWDLYSLVECLAAAKGHVNPLGNPDHFATRYLEDGKSSARRLKREKVTEFRQLLADYIVRTTKRDSRLLFPERQVRTIYCEATAGERDLQGLVGTSLRGMNRLAQVSLAEALMSSPRALLSQLRNMAASGTVPHNTVAEAQAIAPRAGPGCKMERLLRVLTELKSERPRDWRAVVFTRRKETQDLIAEELERREIKCGFIRGAQAAANNRAIKGFWEEAPAFNVLVCTDAGAEGVNLQTANVVVNYDLPWNPMVVEQRIGRVQRLASKHKYVAVFNLVVKHSVEEAVVARLLEKLQAISTTIGDIEGILEASSVGEGGDLEEEIRDLVIKALMGQNVEEATKRIRESIEEAKKIYDAERETVEKTLGKLDAMHSAGPAMPDLTPVKPRLDVRTFTLSALEANGAVLSDESRRLLCRLSGQNPFFLTFDENDPHLLDGGFGGQTTHLFAEGRPMFERLVGEWSKKESQLVSEPVVDRDVVEEVPKRWVENLNASAAFVSFEEDPSAKAFHFAGDLALRASASVAHDKFEKLCALRVRPEGHDPLPSAAVAQGATKKGKLRIGPLVSDVAGKARKQVEGDNDIRKFCEFYEARLVEEKRRAGGNGQLEQQAHARFLPSLAAELVAANGVVYPTVSGRARFTLGTGGFTYDARLSFVPHSGQILEAPKLDRCEETGSLVPDTCLGLCAITRKRVLRSLLRCSESSDRLALEAHTRRCEVTGRLLLSDEVATSDVSGITADRSLLKTSPLSKRMGLESEMKECAFTRVPLFPDEVFVSEISGKACRKDEVLASDVSGKRGHRSEFLTCAKTRGRMLPDESGKSDVSGRIVRADLLVPSEKDPTRRSLRDETEVCAITGKRLLRDEVEVSHVSGKSVDRDLAVRSEASGLPALPEEMVRCEETGAMLLPDETDVCAVSGKRVDRRKLLQSALSGKRALVRFTAVCQETTKRVLESELVRCEVTGERVVPEVTTLCSATNKVVLTRLTDVCAICARRLLRDKGVQSGLSGRFAHGEHAIACPWTGTVGLDDEVGRCARTGVPFPKKDLDQAGVCAPIVDLVRHWKDTSRMAAPLRAKVENALVASGIKVRRGMAVVSEAGPIAAAIVDCSTLLGLRRRHAVLLVDIAGDGVVLGKIAIGRIESGLWRPA